MTMLTDTAASASAATNVSHSQCNGTALSDCLKHVWNVHRNVLRGKLSAPLLLVADLANRKCCKKTTKND